MSNTSWSLISCPVLLFPCCTTILPCVKCTSCIQRSWIPLQETGKIQAHKPQLRLTAVWIICAMNFSNTFVNIAVKLQKCPVITWHKAPFFCFVLQNWHFPSCAKTEKLFRITAAQAGAGEIWQISAEHNQQGLTVVWLLLAHDHWQGTIQHGHTEKKHNHSFSHKTRGGFRLCCSSSHPTWWLQMYFTASAPFKPKEESWKGEWHCH